MAVVGITHDLFQIGLKANHKIIKNTVYAFINQQHGMTAVAVENLLLFVNTSPNTTRLNEMETNQNVHNKHTMF